MHVAIIMDGNGRWAQQRRHARTWGHVRGARVAKHILLHLARQHQSPSLQKVKCLSLFAFSTENWQRPQKEVDFLMHLIVQQLQKAKNLLLENNIGFFSLGDLKGLPRKAALAMEQLQHDTRNSTGLKLVCAINFGGRQEIFEAARRVAQQSYSHTLHPDELSPRVFEQFMESSFLPAPDLIIRTGGEQRLSNFFLWSAAYSELYFSPILWPDFTSADLDKALKHYYTVGRRFGKVDV